MNLGKYSILTVLILFSFLNNFGFPVVVTAQKNTDKGLIAILDGRNKKSNEKALSEKEKDFIEKEVRRNEKEIIEIGEQQNFKCAEDSFSFFGKANGSFTQKNSKQIAFLYRICLDDGGKYALPLGGILIVENQKTIAHYVYSGVWFDSIKSLPDINQNGLSEFALKFVSYHNGLNFSRAIGVYEVKSNELNNLANLDLFSHLSENDADLAYKSYVKKGKSPVFYQEVFESEYEVSKWSKKESLKLVSSPPETEKIFVKLTGNKSENLTAKEVSEKMLSLLKSLRNADDIAPANIEQITGIKVLIDEKDKRSYGFGGKIADAPAWNYLLMSLSDNRLEFSFYNPKDEKAELLPVCQIDYETYKNELLKAGFTVEPFYGEHGRLLYWNFEKSSASVHVNAYKYEQKECVKSIILQVTDSKLPELKKITGL